MTRMLRTDCENQDFIDLVALLDTDLSERDGDDHAFYDQFNGIDNLNQVIVLYANARPVACGALKPSGMQAMEVKRMFVVPSARGQGYATQVLKALELWARELGKTYCVLETGQRQPEAIALYKKNGYRIIPNFAPYIGIENSVCFQKSVS